MACYCDSPESTDQKEIEKRCKERMYFDAQSLLTREQARECEKRNLKQFPLGDINDHLCKLCKVLTEDQMKTISSDYWGIEWPHKNMNEWHIKHCQDDKQHNGDER